MTPPPFTRLTTDSYWRIVLLAEGGLLRAGKAGAEVHGLIGIQLFNLVILRLRNRNGSPSFAIAIHPFSFLSCLGIR